jgi:hypothetical protein
MTNTAMIQPVACALPLSSIQPLPRKVANGGRSAKPNAARLP